MSTRQILSSALVSFLFSGVAGLWFYPNKRRMRTVFILSFIVSFACMLVAMSMPL